MIRRKNIRLSEVTRYKEETGKNLPRWQDQLVKYEEEGGYFIHFSNIPRMNLYIVNKFNTPIGFYAYPLDRDKMEEFAIERPYAIILKPKSEANILELIRYSESNYKADVDKLVEMGNSLEIIDKAAKEAKNKTPGGKIWNVTRVLSGAVGKKEEDLSVTRGGGSTGKWSMLLKKLGYDGVNDDCLSIIHTYEPCQAVFFDTTKLDLVKVIDLKGSKISSVDDLFDVEEREYQKKIALTKKSSPKLLASLAQDSDWRVREQVAWNKSTPPEVLKSLLFDENSIRLGLANNTKSPEDLLMALANDGEDRVRDAVGRNSAATPKVLSVLVNLKDEDNVFIRRAIVNHPNVTPDILKRLAEDSSMLVRLSVANDQDVPAEVLTSLATDEREEVRAAIAANRNTPPEVLRNLANEEEEISVDVRAAVADNPRVPRYILDILAKDSDNYVRRNAFQRLTVYQKMTEALVMEKVLWKLTKRKL